MREHEKRFYMSTLIHGGEHDEGLQASTASYLPTKVLTLRYGETYAPCAAAWNLMYLYFKPGGVAGDLSGSGSQRDELSKQGLLGARLSIGGITSSFARWQLRQTMILCGTLLHFHPRSKAKRCSLRT